MSRGSMAGNGKSRIRDEVNYCTLYVVDEVNVTWVSWLMPSLIVWMLNGVVMAAVLAKLFVFGEPVTKPLTASSVSYWRSRRQADVYLAAVSSLTFSQTLKCFLDLFC